MYSREEETRQSPLSYFCAKLVDSILPPKMTMQSAKSRGIFAVQWFCGQHTNFYDYGPGMSDYDAHPPGMLSNMVGQSSHSFLGILSYRSSTISALSGQIRRSPSSAVSLRRL